MPIVSFEKDQIEPKPTHRVDRDDDSSTMEPAEDMEIAVNGSCYRLGDVLCEKDGDIASAARSIVDNKKKVEELHRLMAIMALSFLLVAVSTMAVSIWANRLMKDVFVDKYAMTDSRGMVLATTKFQVNHEGSIFDLYDEPWHVLSSVSDVNFKIGNMRVEFRPTIIIKEPDSVTLKAHGSKLIITADTFIYAPLGEEPQEFNKFSGRMLSGSDEEEKTSYNMNRPPCIRGAPWPLGC